MADPNRLPLLTFAEAELIGIAIHDRFVANGVMPPLTRDDLGWGDLVQFVMRRAYGAVADRKAMEAVHVG